MISIVNKSTTTGTQRVSSIKTRIKTRAELLIQAIVILREYLPLKQGLRLLNNCISFHNYFSESIFHYSKDK